MTTLNIAGAVSNIVDAVDVGREIYETTVNAMDAAEKERDSGAIKKHGYWLSLNHSWLI